MKTSTYITQCLTAIAAAVSLVACIMAYEFYNRQMALASFGSSIQSGADSFSQHLKEQEVQDQEDSKLITVTDVKHSQVEDEPGYVRCTGNVHNGSTRTVRYWQVDLRIYDKNDTVIDSEYDNDMGSLVPGASKPFKIRYHATLNTRGTTTEVGKVTFETQ